MFLTPANARVIVLRQHEAGLLQTLVQPGACGLVCPVNQGGEKGLDFAHPSRHILSG